MAIAQEILSHEGSAEYVAKVMVKSIFKDYTLQDWIKPFLSVTKSFDCPVLTTNYDISLGKILHLEQRTLSGLNYTRSRYSFETFETYFAPTPIKQPWNSFAIWHIHGLYNYVNSIRIGKSDYEVLLREILNRLSQTREPKTDENWSGNNTWLSILFRKNLFIWGLGLKQDESVLWWLLEERVKYGLKGWYVCRDMEDITTDKINKLQYVGLNVIKVDNSDLHENVWKNILSKLDAVGTDDLNNLEY